MMNFAKAHAYGNDFIYIERAELTGVALALLARQICDRHAGVGADGLIVFDRTAAGATMQLFNADGSRAEVSGNGVRGLAALLLQDEHTVQNARGTEAVLTIETEAGPKRVTRLDRSGTRQTFRTAMGLPADLRPISITVDGESVQAVVMNVGNPQCVLLGPLPQQDRFRRLGRALEHHTRFPAGTNVEFAEVETRNSVRILIWERGVGPTASSGSGSCAALVAAAAFGGADRDATVIAPGGAQRVEWRDDSVYLTGWAEVVCKGEWLGEPPR